VRQRGADYRSCITLGDVRQPTSANNILNNPPSFNPYR
jgi:hypothetical protein